MPQIGAVLVPINFRLTAADFAYIINHSGARVVCVHPDYLAAVDGIRARLPQVRHFVALEGGRQTAGLRGWPDYEQLLSEARGSFARPEIRRTRSADHQLHERDDLTPEGRDDHAPQRLHERRRHADPSADDAGRSLSVDAADVSRQWLDVHMDRHRGRAAFTSACRRSIRRSCSS